LITHTALHVPAYIGDEVEAAGYRLAGLAVYVARREDLRALIRSACEQAPLVLIGAASARELPAAELDRLLASVTPPVVVVPDVRQRAGLPDLATRLRGQLGVLE
jgi:vacuolar-type H+-ATPase subunit F/Vma7